MDGRVKMRGRLPVALQQLNIRLKLLLMVKVAAFKLYHTITNHKRGCWVITASWHELPW